MNYLDTHYQNSGIKYIIIIGFHHYFYSNLCKMELRDIIRSDCMKELLIKPNIRRLDLIQLLNTDKGDLTIKDLAHQLNCTERVIKEDISVLNKKLKERVRIYSVNEIIKIKFNPSIGVDYVAKTMMNESLAFQLLERVFFKENVSLDEVAVSLFVSSSSLYRYVGNINQYLKEQFNLKLQTNPCKLVGDEESIRYFYIQFFIEKYLVGEWPFEDRVSESAIESILKDAIDRGLTSIDFHKMHRLKIMIAVKLIRIRSGYSIDTSDVDLSHYEQYIPNAMNWNVEGKLHIEFTPKMIYELFATNLSNSPSFSLQDFLQKVTEDERTNHSFSKLYQLLNTIKYEFNIEPQNKDLIIFNLHNAFHRSESEMYSNFILIDSKGTFVNVLEHSFPKFYLRLENLLESYIKHMGAEPTEPLMNQLIYTVFASWDDLIIELQRQAEQMRVLVISKYDKGHANLLSKFTGIEYLDKLNLTVTIMEEDEDLTSDIDKVKEQFDLVIGNFTLPDRDDFNFICVNDMPTLSDIKKVQRELFKYYYNLKGPMSYSE